VTLVGPCTQVGEEGVARGARDTFLAAHPEAAGYASFRDFAMYRLEPVAVRYVGGFGRMSWVGLADYLAASPDPLAEAEATIVQHMNDDHPDATLAYARTFGRIPTATRALMTAIDRYGFELLAVTSDGEQQVRIPFTEDVTSPDAARRALIALVRDARAALTHP
jgi:putative heme iron utilization protein